MKKRYSRRLTIRRLLTLLLTVVLVEVGSVSKQVNGASLVVNPLQNVKEDWWDHLKQGLLSGTQPRENSIGFSTQIRKHYLYNQCSKQLVKVKGTGRQGINAKGRMRGKNMAFSELVFSPTSQGTIVLFGRYTEKAICFNKKGILVAKDLSKAKKLKYCQFVEEDSTDKNYTHYRSAEKELWYMGFKKNGKTLTGPSIHKNSADCFKFLKLNEHPRTGPVCNPEKGKGPENVNFCDKKFLNITLLKSLRHDKHRKGRRKD